MGTKFIPRSVATEVVTTSEGTAFGEPRDEVMRREVELEGILNCTADAILAVDSDGRVIRFNHRFTELWNIPPRLLDGGDDASLLAFVVDQLVDPEHFLSRVRELYRSALTDMDTLAFKDGRVIERYSSPLMANGAMIGRVWSFRDVSMRKFAEDTLLKSEKRHRAIVLSAMDGYMLGDARGRILEVNQACCEMYGYTDQQLYALRVPELLQPGREAEAEAHIAEVIVRGARRFESVHRRKDGSLFDVEVSMSYLSVDGGRIVAFMRDISDMKLARESMAEHVRQLEMTMRGTLKAAANMAALRDPYTSGHERRVGIIASDIAREMGWSKEKCEKLLWIGQVHDIGKVGVPAEILAKPGSLTEAEYGLVKSHAELGHQILKDIDFPMPVAAVILQHHERMDGSGYPQGLKGEEILPEARILAVADVLESMSSHRPYRPALGLQAAIGEIESHRGRCYDPVVVDTVLHMIRAKGYELPV